MPKPCPYCNANMGIKAKYCPRCGKKQPELTERQKDEFREKEREHRQVNRTHDDEPEITSLRDVSPRQRLARQWAASKKQQEERKPDASSLVRHWLEQDESRNPTAPVDDYSDDTESGIHADEQPGAKVSRSAKGWAANSSGVRKPTPVDRGKADRGQPENSAVNMHDSQHSNEEHDGYIMREPSQWAAEQTSTSKKQYPLYLLAIIPVVVLGILLFGRSPTEQAEVPTPTPVATTPAPTPTPTPEPTPTPTETPTPMEPLQALVDGGEATQYKPYTLTDNTVGIPVLSTLLPNGWSGNGVVLWDYHSADSPGRYVFTAVSPDGMAGLTVSSPMHFVNVEVEGWPDIPLDNVLPGIQKEARLNGIDLAGRFIPTFNANLNNINITNWVVGLDVQANFANYQARMETRFNALREAGLTVESPFVEAAQLTGFADSGGGQVEINVDIVTNGYTCMDYSNEFTTKVEYWNLDYLCVYYAPNGGINNYMPDMQLIMNNFHVNQSWLAVGEKVSDGLNSWLSENQQATYADMPAQGHGLLTEAASSASGDVSYQTIAASSDIDFYQLWPEAVKAHTSYRGSLLSQVNIDNKWEQVWVGDNGEVIGANNEEYDPNEDETQNAQSWVNVSK